MQRCMYTHTHTHTHTHFLDIGNFLLAFAVLHKIKGINYSGLTCPQDFLSYNSPAKGTLFKYKK